MLQRFSSRRLTASSVSLLFALLLLGAQPGAASDVVLQGSLCAGSGCATAGGSVFVTDDGKLGVGTATPANKLEVAGGDMKVGKTSGGLTSLFLENTGGSLTASWILRANGANGAFSFTEAGVGISPFRILPGAAQNTLSLTTTGVSVVGSLVVNGVTMTVPDYVFEPTYELLPLRQQGAYMSTHKHLPAVGGATYDTDGRAVVDLGAHQMGMLEELEKAHLYIQQLDAKIEEKDDRIAALEARLARLEAALE